MIISCFTMLTIVSKRWIYIVAFLLFSIGALGQTQTFSSNGSFTVPAGVTSIIVECRGAGGGGSNRAGAAGGGGGGAYTRGTITGLTPGAAIAVTVGTGAAGTNGTASSIGAISANGGLSVNNSRNGGAGGAASVVGGNVLASYSGGTGGNARANTGGVNNEGGGGGGGSATTTANGGVGGNATATGGTGGTGYGPGGSGADGDGAPDAVAGTIPGGGGGGRGEAASTSKAGANGQVIVSWTQPVFYSQGSGNPGTVSNWNTIPAGGGYTPATFTTDYQTFIVQSGHNMSTTGVWSVSGNSTIVQISNNASITANNAITFSAATTFQIDNGGTYFQNHNTNNNIFNGTNTLGASSTVNYMLAGAQTVAGIVYGNLTLSGSSTKTLTGATVNAILSMEGTAIAAGTAPTYGGGSTLQYKGSAAQTNGIEMPATFSGSGGIVVNNAAGITLSANVTVSTALSLTQGNVTTGAFTLALTNGVAGSLTRVSGTVIGKFRRTISTTLANDYIFPVGNASFYRPAVMNFSSLSAGTDITAEFIATPPAGFVAYIDGISNLSNTFSEGYWRFFCSGPPTGTYSLSLTGNGFSSYTINEASRITGRDNGNTTWRALGTHGSQSGNDVSRSGVTNLNSTSFDFALANGCIPPSMGYSYERNITIDNTKVSGGANLYNFPVLINITGQNFLKTLPTGQITSVNGFDIIFTDDTYGKLDHQIEYYNGTAGDLIAWVRIPTLSNSSATVIKILYGNQQITTDPSVTTVWDSHYKGVWHLDNNSLNDFTSINKSGTSYNSPTYPAGRIYNSLGMNGTSHYVEVINDPATNFAGNITISAWVYMNAGGRDQKIAGNQNNSSGGYKFGIYTNNKVEFEIRNSANTPSLNRDVTGGTFLATGQWYYLAGISSDVLDSIKTFVNGTPERPFKKTGVLGTASNTLTIGKEPFQASYYFSGMSDEVRISDEVRSNGWMMTEYNNQSSPSTFYTIDAAGVSANNLPSSSICNGSITLTFGYPAGGTYSGNPDIAGNVFTPPSAGTYSIIYIYNGGCGPTSVTKDFIITDAPAAPVASNREFCATQITYLEATTGENIRWYNGGSLVSTANPFSTGQTVPGTYNYTVTQTVNGCESTPAAVSLTIYNGVTITTQPLPSTICAGNNATFTVVAAGYNLTYRWQENGVNISDGGIYSGATTVTLTLTNPGIANNGKSYRCVVTSSCGASSVNSSAALLTVNSLPVATFSYTGTPYCPNAANPSPVFSGGGVAGTFSSTSGLVFVSTATGQINIAASTPGSYTVTNTIAASGGCSIVTAISPFTITSNLVWTGAVSTDWNVAGNWTCGLIPNSGISVQIPNIANKPVLSAGAMGAVRNVVIDLSSSLTVSGNTLQISGTITNNGTFTATNGNIELNGSAAQSIGTNIFAGNTIKDLIINNSAGTTLLAPLNISGVLTPQNGNLASDGNLTLLSTAAQTALISGSGTGNVTGIVTMQRYLPSAYGYKYFSSPFQAATVNEFSDDMTLSSFTFYRYDESRSSSGWVSYNPPANILNPVEGYAVNFGSNAAASTVDVSGVVNNGNLSITLYNHNNTYTKGFNLAGNPYPSPIDWNAAAGWTKTNIDNALYYFKASTTDQYGGTYATYVNGISSDGIVNNIIPSMQGFLVHVSNGAFPVTGTLGLTNSVRITDLTHPFSKKKSIAPSNAYLRLTVVYSNDINLADPAVIYFDEKAASEYDNQLDALKLMNTDLNVPNLYSVTPAGTKLSVKALPLLTNDSCKVPLGLKLNRTGSGTITIKISDIDEILTGRRIYISDEVDGTEQDLLPDKQFSISLEKGEYLNRFFLNISTEVTDIEDNPQTTDLFGIYSYNGILKAEINVLKGGKGRLVIYNLTGQVLYIKEVFDTGYLEFNPGLKDGIYIVNYITGTKRSSKKLFIQNWK